MAGIGQAGRMVATGLAALALAAGAAAPANAAPANAAPANAVPPNALPANAEAFRDGPRLLAVDPPVLFENRTRWVHEVWLGTGTVCEFRLTAAGPGLRVGYPTNTATYTSFFRDSSLSRLEPDYTALNLTATRAGTVPMRLHMTYRHLRADGTCAAEVRHRNLTVRLAVLPT